MWGVYLTAVYLPLDVAHGYTRREFATLALGFVPAFAAVIAVLVAVGFVIEWAAYGLLGWPQTLTREAGLYDSPTQFHLAALHHWLTFVTLTLVGALGGAGCYRGWRWGAGCVVTGLAVLTVVSGVLGISEALPGLPLVLGVVRESLPLGLGIYAVAVTVAAAVTWLAVRDLPIRTRNT